MRTKVGVTDSCSSLSFGFIRVDASIMAIQGEGWKSGTGLLKGPGIPAPTGQYRVGCVDLMHQLEGDDKGLLVRLHFPTAATPEQGYQYSKCNPHRKYVRGFLHFLKSRFPGILSGVINAFTAPKLPALEGAPLIEPVTTDGGDEATPTQAPSTFPLIVFSHGLGAIRTMYSAIACDLVSHGYVVACVEHRDLSASMTLQRVPKPGQRAGELQDKWVEFYHLAEGEEEFPLRNKQVSQRADEVRKTLDILTLLNEGAEVRNMLESSYDFQQFKGRLDISMAAVMGHSFGGATTVQTLAEDKRFKCGLALDCWMLPLSKEIYEEGSSLVTQPLYFINSFTFQWKENVWSMMSMTRPPPDDGDSVMTTCRIMTLKGTHHNNQCDVPFVVPTNMSWLSPATFQESRLDNLTAHQINMDICHAFLKRYLLEDPAYQQPIPNLDGTEGHSEHIIFGTNVDLSDNDKTEGSSSDAAGTGAGGGAKEEAEGGVAGEGGADDDEAAGKDENRAAEKEATAEKGVTDVVNKETEGGVAGDDEAAADKGAAEKEATTEKGATDEEGGANEGGVATQAAEEAEKQEEEKNEDLGNSEGVKE